MNNLNYAYNLGLLDDFNEGNLTSDKYYKKLLANKGLQANLKSLNTQVSLTKAYSNSKLKTVDSFILVLESISLSLLRKNTQAYDYKLTKLNRYGSYLNELRNIIYQSQNTEKGFMGTLLYYQSGEGETLSILDSIEKCLLNFWNHIGVDPLLKPRERWLYLLKDLELESSIEFYQDLELNIKELVATNKDIKAKMNLLLLDFNDLKHLKRSILTLELDESLILFMEWLKVNLYIDFDIISYKNKLLNFNPIGSINLVLIAFIVEGLLLTARYLTYLGVNIRMLDIQDFLNLKDYEDVRTEISNYLALSYDANDYLVNSFDDSNLLKEALFNTIKTFMVEDIESKGEYRLDG